jgi:hypothetical protein
MLSSLKSWLGVSGRMLVVPKKQACPARPNLLSERSVARCQTSGGEAANITIARRNARSTYKTPAAREIRRITMLSEMKICIIARIFAQRARSGASVGPKVELWVKATKR